VGQGRLGWAAYEGYNEHPDHVRFVQERWLAEVSDFLELDYVARYVTRALEDRCRSVLWLAPH
jgi:hypothetical protein